MPKMLYLNDRHGDFVELRHTDDQRFIDARVERYGADYIDVHVSGRGTVRIPDDQDDFDILIERYNRPLSPSWPPLDTSDSGRRP